MKGSTYPSEQASRLDKVTGVLVHQMTSHASISHLTYFLQSSFTPDSKTLLFTSYRGGNAQLYEVGFPDGEIRQLTDGAPIHAYSPALSPLGDHVFFVRGGGIWSINRTSLEETLIVEFAGGQLGECTLSRSGDWITAAIKQGSQQGLVTGRADGSGWRMIPFTRTVIHPQYHPVDRDWLEFAADPAPRMYRVRRDGTGMECLYTHDGSEWITHETFLGSTGDLVFVHWPKALYRMDWTTRAIRPVTNNMVWHISPNRSGTRILCDTNHPDQGVFEIDVATGARRHICLTESSNGGTQWTKPTPANWKVDAKSALSWLEVPADTIYGPQYTHPHPCYSPGEDMVTFTSDRTGRPQVYVAEKTVTR